MRQDNRMPRVLHALLHLDQMTEPATSDLLARMLNTNAAVVRRTMAGLRDQGFVTSTKPRCRVSAQAAKEILQQFTSFNLANTAIHFGTVMA